jgi:hypothetical protein
LRRLDARRLFDQLCISEMTRAISKSARNLAWFAVVNGVLAACTPGLHSIFSKQLVPAAAFVQVMPLAIASFIAGLYGLKAKSWAFWLLFLTFLVQTVEYFSEGFYFSFIGPLSLKFGWGWKSPPSHFNLNILAIAVCVLAARAAAQLASDSAENDA